MSFWSPAASPTRTGLLLSVPHALRLQLELICDAKQEGEQHFVRLNDGKVRVVDLPITVLYCVARN